MTAAPGDATHIYIVQQTGQILTLDLQTNVISSFFTVTGLTTVNEEGLLGMAFDPNYATNGRFYLDFTVPGAFFIVGLRMFRSSS